MTTSAERFYRISSNNLLYAPIQGQSRANCARVGPDPSERLHSPAGISDDRGLLEGLLLGIGIGNGCLGSRIESRESCAGD